MCLERRTCIVLCSILVMAFVWFLYFCNRRNFRQLSTRVSDFFRWHSTGARTFFLLLPCIPSYLVLQWRYEHMSGGLLTYVASPGVLVALINAAACSLILFHVYATTENRNAVVVRAIVCLSVMVFVSFLRLLPLYQNLFKWFWVRFCEIMAESLLILFLFLETPEERSRGRALSSRQDYFIPNIYHSRIPIADRIPPIIMRNESVQNIGFVRATNIVYMFGNADTNNSLNVHLEPIGGSNSTESPRRRTFHETAGSRLNYLPYILRNAGTNNSLNVRWDPIGGSNSAESPRRRTFLETAGSRANYLPYILRNAGTNNSLNVRGEPIGGGNSAESPRQGTSHEAVGFRARFPSMDKDNDLIKSNNENCRKCEENINNQISLDDGEGRLSSASSALSRFEAPNVAGPSNYFPNIVAEEVVGDRGTDSDPERNRSGQETGDSIDDES